MIHAPPPDYWVPILYNPIHQYSILSTNNMHIALISLPKQDLKHGAAQDCTHGEEKKMEKRKGKKHKYLMGEC